MREKTLDLIGFDDPFLDLVIEIDKLPASDANCTMYERCFQGGGNVATALCTASRLGLRTALIGCVGDDLFGRMSVADLEYHGVDTSGMIVRQGKTSNFSVCAAERDVKGKEFFVGHGDFEHIQPEELDEERIRSAKMLHTGLITPAVVRACDIMHASGGKVSVDTPYYRPHVTDHYACFDVLIGSEMFYRDMCADKGLDEREYEKNMNVIRRHGCEIVIITFGAAGCRGVSGDGYFEVPAIPVNVVDTTGAGDVFHGAFDTFYLKGFDAKTSAAWASGVSAVKCTRPGGRAGIPTMDVLERFMQTGEIDYSEIDERVEHYKRGLLQ